MIDLSVARLSRGVAVEMGMEVGIRPFYGIALAYLDRREAAAILDRAVFLYPHDLEGRGLHVRRHARELR